MFTRYGNWVANTRLPQFGFVRRLAASNPNAFGKFVAYIAFCNGLNAGFRFYTNRVIKNVLEVTDTNLTVSDILAVQAKNTLASKEA